ncbi:MAG: hypothetical protein COV29_02840 [Candidatus Yanofskybacteria bacterium CG10_big_fil_rev_8_21_14_0_10_36_16]|uniref:Glycosyl transferase family 1 domain-containing protein n=1 Tax=Candidatus Yanofskybacteria bacterium CG10_big_fil_rev_8_21_14_0_10_36_16 TaxID=1975096 RepID=A0A2J0Q899_9BACT|nr:MAG: hypothetical protein COV29_02840 [Candidatus Yanofskybacteria bacterium CG10_big_fil_rev_8_21_14_0_10_36_16]
MKIIKKEHGPVVYISSYPPRECGIATFTQDLAIAFDKKYNPVIRTGVIALNERPTTFYNYNPKVWGYVVASEINDYVALAKELNHNKKIKVVNIQHEFGLFGGSWGDYIVPFLQVIEKPVVITLHSVLPNPDDHLKKTMELIARNAEALIVMNQLSKETLESDYDIPGRKIFLVPHGIPQTSFESTEKSKEQYGLQGKTVLSTFGLLSPNKGVEHTIRALPPIVKKHPNLIYLVLGITHPIVRGHSGESYRNFLMKEVKKLKLENNVKFYNKYLTLEEIVDYLKATDIYICSANDVGQSVSGTLSYAMGCGRPIVSTRSVYAKYLINKDSGILVNPGKHREISRAILKLLSDPKRLKEMNKEAYEITRPMTWPNVATSYFKIYKKFADLEPEENKLPEINLGHTMHLTDKFGMIQFAKYSKPELRHGYTLDDNARALIAAAMYYEIEPKPETLKLIKTYLKFIKYVQRGSGTFANVVSRHKNKDRAKDEDVQGRAVWALGYISSCNFLPEEIRDRAETMLDKIIPHANNLESPRAMAFSMVGLYHYMKRYPQKTARIIFSDLAETLFKQYKKHSTHDWKWFENYFTYSNSKLAEVMFYAYEVTGKKKFLKVAKESLAFLSQVTTEKNGQYWPIGQNGWYFKNKQRSFFDQQPEDTASMVQTKVVAYETTKNKRYLQEAFSIFNWFLGKNHLGQMVYDETTGGCYDGIHQNRINLNQGAESTVSYLLARLALEKYKKKV